MTSMAAEAAVFVTPNPRKRDPLEALRCVRMMIEKSRDLIDWAISDAREADLQDVLSILQFDRVQIEHRLEDIDALIAKAEKPKPEQQEKP